MIKSRFPAIASGAVVALSEVVVGTAGAQFDENLYIDLHLTQPSYDGCASGSFIDEADDCRLRTLHPPIDGQGFIWFFVRNNEGYPNGVGGVQFGIDHDLSASWTLCSGGLEIQEPGWPASGTGNAITWADGCYFPPGDVNARIGLFAMNDASRGRIRVTPDPRTGTALFADCTATQSKIFSHHLAFVDDIAYGVESCLFGGATPLERGSWSEVKRLF